MINVDEHVDIGHLLQYGAGDTHRLQLRLSWEP